MKARMVYDLVANWLFNKKKILIYFIVFVLFALFFFALKIYVNLLYPQDFILKKAQEVIAAFPFAINFDALEMSPFQGLVIRNLKVSAEPDFNRGRKMFFADKVSVMPYWISFLKGEFKTKSIVFSKAEINYYFEKDETNKKEIEQWKWFLERLENIKIFFSKSELNIFFIKAPYEKDQWTFENLKGIIDFSKEKEVFLEYSNPNLDQGELSLKFKECGKICLIEKIKYQFQNFPLSRLRILLNKNVLVIGKASGFYAEELGHDEKTRRAELELLQTSLFLHEENFISANQAFFSIIGIERKNKHLINLNSDIEGNQFHFEVVLANSPLPELFLWESKRIGRTFILPKGFSLRGFKNIFLKFLKKDTEYFLDMDLSITDGALYKEDSLLCKIPNVKFFLKEKKLNGQAELLYDRTQVKMNTQGELIPIVFNYRPIAYPLLTGYGKESYPMLGLKGKLKNEFFVENLYLNDINKGLVELKDFYTKKVIEALQESYSPSRIRDREFFKRFVENLELEQKVFFKNLVFSPKDILEGSGFLKINPIETELKLDFGSENFIELKYSYPSNIPYLSGRYQISLQDGFAFLSTWLDNKVFEKFLSTKWNYSFFASGESLSDLYLSHHGRGEIFFTHVVLGNEAKKRYINPIWDELKVFYKRQGPLTEIQRYEAKNQNFLLEGNGTIRESNLQKNYQFNFKLKQQN